MPNICFYECDQCEQMIEELAHKCSAWKDFRLRLWSKDMLVQRNCWPPKNFLSERIFGPKYFSFRHIFGLRKL